MILVILMLGLVFFVVNWIRCIRKRPQQLEDDLEDLRIIEMNQQEDEMKRRNLNI